MVIAIVGISAYLAYVGLNAPQAASTTKPVILYVNQGNLFVNESTYPQLLSVAKSHGFNTIFFQVYRGGTLLYNDSTLSQFAVSAHKDGLKIFFALLFSNATNPLPTNIYHDGEDGISFDMSSLSINDQYSIFDNVTASYTGKTAITTTDPTLPLKPDLLVLETYEPGYQQYIHPGIIGSVEVVNTTSQADYNSAFYYALDNSDGVMVFDYAGLLKSGY